MSFLAVAIAGAIQGALGSIAGQAAQHRPTREELLKRAADMQNALAIESGVHGVSRGCPPGDPLCEYCLTRSGKTECRNCGAAKG
jgi:hypothetical protein